MPGCESQGPHSHILMTGGEGGLRVIFLDLKFWPKVFFLGSMKDVEIFLGRKWVAKKELRDFFWGMLRKVLSDFFG